ncbi:unnamed protein product [Rhizoctonia solani]|uniref:Uncharacterized protein n=1 Tax=Rhizoctonia solani TaxID=456999 RepID=A0A8H3BCH0_9AGAM|nr:unnamed protein product [Rhizoctonia solani]
MSSILHSSWGRATGSYRPSPDLYRSVLSVDAELAGLQAIQTVSELATEAQIVTPNTLGNGISVSMLESALSLALDPATVRHLGNPPFISGCIQLMKTMVRPHSAIASPFSYEYGYLCFKLLVTALNVCLLERWKELDKALTGIDNYSQKSAQATISAKIASVVLGQLMNLYIGGDCDSVLGWFTPASKLRQSSLISQSDVSTLFDLLWADRKLLLQALCDTSPEPVNSNRVLENCSNSACLSSRYDIIWSHKSTSEAMALIIGSNQCSRKWNDTPKHVDSEDSRTIMSAYIKQISDDRHPLAVARDPSIAPSFVPLAMDAQTQDLLPKVMECTIKYAWFALLDEEEADKLEALVDIICGSLL